MNQAVLILIIFIVCVLLLIGVNMYMKHMRALSDLEERRKDNSQARSVSGAEWATKVDRPEWADRGNAQVKNRSLPDGTTLGSSSGAFSFDDTRKDKPSTRE